MVNKGATVATEAILDSRLSDAIAEVSTLTAIDSDPEFWTSDNSYRHQPDIYFQLLGWAQWQGWQVEVKSCFGLYSVTLIFLEPLVTPTGEELNYLEYPPEDNATVALASAISSALKLERGLMQIDFDDEG